MIRSVIESWEENKNKLAEEIKQTKQSELSYKWFVENIARIIVGIDDTKIHEIDDGEYQGTLIYIFCDSKRYQPCVGDYYLTSVEYGSCSGCDMLEGIREYEEGLPSDRQVKHYMTICLHLVQRMIKLIPPNP
jgi:hypothetical protein